MPDKDVQFLLTDIPEGSIYFWMYGVGLRRIPFEQVESALARAGKTIRKKDEQNYWNGYYNSQLYCAHGTDPFSLHYMPPRAPRFEELKYTDYKEHPFKDMPDVEKRWVPCSKEGKPLFKWGLGCLSKVDAMSYLNCETLAENMKGTQYIVFDCDGDHDKDKLDLDVIRFMSKYMNKTHCIMKPKLVYEYGEQDVPEDDPVLCLPASFHLTFKVDRVIPTMHFPYAHLDIVGNEKNSLRYWKNKVWNGEQPALMTDEVWEDFKVYVEGRR